MKEFGHLLPEPDSLGVRINEADGVTEGIQELCSGKLAGRLYTEGGEKEN